MALKDAFVWGSGGAQLTPDQIARQREIAAALIKNGMDYSPIQSWTQGAARVSQGILGALEDRDADNKEKANTEADKALQAPLIQALYGSAISPAAVAGPSADASSPAGTPSPVAASSPQVAPDQIKALIAQNVPADLQGYATNLIGHESSFDPNAVSPTGATGLAQFTRGTGKQYGLVGPNGDMRADPVANLKALVALTNDNKAALTKALGRAPTDGELALAHQQGVGGAISLLSGKSVPSQNLAVNNIDPNSDPRAAAAKIMKFYGGTGGQQVASLDPSAGLGPSPQQAYVDPQVTTAPQVPPAVQAIQQQAPIDPTQTASLAPQAPQLPSPVNIPNQPISNPAPVQVPQAVPNDLSGVGMGGAAPGPGYFPPAPSPPGAQPAPPSGGVSPAVIAALTSPQASPATRQLAGAIVQQAQARQQLLLKQQLEQADPAYQTKLQTDQIQLRNLQHPENVVPDSVRALNARASAAGLQPGTPAYNDFMITGGNKAPAVVGAPPAGYKIDYDAAGNPVSMSAIPGGPADTSSGDAAAADNRDTSTDVITSAADRARQALSAPGMPATGIAGSIASLSPSSNAAEVRRQVEVLKSNAKIETLNAMRKASKTGGALGAVSDSENAMLAAKAGALDPNSPNFARDLNDYERSLLRTVHGKQAGDEIWLSGNASRFPNAPKIGAIEDGHQYIGGDPAQPDSWKASQ